MRKKKMGTMKKICVMIFAIYAAMTLLVLQAQISERTERAKLLKEQILEEKIVLTALSEAIASEPDDEYYKRVAREKFGLVETGEVIIVDIS